MIDNDTGFNKHNKNVEKSSDYVDVERAMIIGSYTVVDPWAMVIKALDTLITNIAMSTSFCSYNLAFGTKMVWVKLFNNIHEIDIGISFYVTRIFEPTHYKRNH